MLWHRSLLFKISLPDGSVREMPAGSTPADVAAAIGPGLAKAALAARIDGELVDLTRRSPAMPAGAGHRA
jgi:threonyl-tRNA synthetase